MLAGNETDACVDGDADGMGLGVLLSHAVRTQRAATSTSDRALTS
jgi:hypothetical protein